MPVERATFKLRTFACAECGAHAQALRWGTDPPPTCHGGMHEVSPAVSPTVMIATDDIPGGLLMEHAVCHSDGTPKKFYSRSAIRKEARAKGWTILGETPKPAGDRWV